MISREEKETIIMFNEADDTASCFTYNGRITKRLTNLATERPEECQLVKDNGVGGLTFAIPKQWVRINPPRVVNLTDEERQLRRDRLAQARSVSNN